MANNDIIIPRNFKLLEEVADDELNFYVLHILKILKSKYDVLY